MNWPTALFVQLLCRLSPFWPQLKSFGQDWSDLSYQCRHVSILYHFVVLWVFAGTRCWLKWNMPLQQAVPATCGPKTLLMLILNPFLHKKQQQQPWSKVSQADDGETLQRTPSEFMRQVSGFCFSWHNWDIYKHFFSKLMTRLFSQWHNEIFSLNGEQFISTTAMEGKKECACTYTPSHIWEYNLLSIVPSLNRELHTLRNMTRIKGKWKIDLIVPKGEACKCWTKRWIREKGESEVHA